jgi:hypothetical protein
MKREIVMIASEEVATAPSQLSDRAKSRAHAVLRTHSGRSELGQIEAISNEKHFSGVAKRVDQLETILPAEINCEVLKAAAWYHDLGKMEIVREKVKDLYSGWKLAGGKPSPREASVYRFIDSLNFSQKIVLSHAWDEGTDEISRARRDGNWVIDHQMLSAVYAKYVLFDDIQMGHLDINTESLLLSVILEHINPPGFMLSRMAEGFLKYTAEEISQLTSCGRKEGDTWMFKRYNGSWESTGFSSPDAWVLAMIDGSQFGDPDGSLGKILCDIFRKEMYWPKLATLNGEIAVPPSLTNAYDGLMRGSFREVEINLLGLDLPWAQRLIEMVHDDQKFTKVDLETKLAERGIPIRFDDVYKKHWLSQNEYNVVKGWSEATLEEIEVYFGFRV